jgi:putative nucleotidyltransferase with HDIG domain/PAS domain S-box-containing protein
MTIYKNLILDNFNLTDSISLQKILDSFPYYVILVDENHNIVMVNDKVYAMTKKSQSEIIGNYCPSVIHGIDHPFYGCPLEEAVKKDRSIEKEIYDPVSGRWLLSCIYLTNCKTEGGLKIFLHATQDITEKKEAQEEADKSCKKLKKALFDIIVTLENIIETKDRYTADHQKRVSKLAVSIAKNLKMDDERIDTVTTAALVHDIGKIGIFASILSKPGALTDLEFSLIKTHPQLGHNLLRKIDFGYPIAKIILQHHERLDGSGYPNGLKEENILFEAKIIAVADVVEAMSSHRPYRPALGIGKALEEIETGKNKLYDSLVVDACLDLFNKENFKF